MADIAKYLRLLRNANPEAFTHLYTAFLVFRDQKVKDLVLAEPGNFQAVQGQLQLTLKLLEIIHDCK